MWPLRQQQRQLGSKNCVDPWHVPSSFFVFLGDKLTSCLVTENFRRSGGGSLRQDEKNHTPVRVGPTDHKR
jgi:hypothetical protein